MTNSPLNPQIVNLVNKNRIPFVFIAFLVVIIVYWVFFAVYAGQKHAAFLTAGYDLGIWDQKLWNILRGRPFIITTQAEVEISLGDHVDVIALLLAPLYAIYTSPQTLIVFQVIWVSLGAFPIYWLARYRLSSSLAGLVFALVYLFFPALESALTFDFHGLTVAVPLLAFGLWAIYRQRYAIFIGASFLAMACQEDVPLLTLMMGLYVMVVQRQWRTGAVVAVGSLVWFITANFFIKPAFLLPGYTMHLVRYNALGHNLPEIILTMLTRPYLVIQQIFGNDKQFYWIRLTMPTAFTAWLDPLTLLMVLPSLLINTLSNYPPTYQLDHYHSSATVVPFITVASINGVDRLIKITTAHFKHVRLGFVKFAFLGMVLAATLAYQIQFGYSPIGRNFSWPVVTPRHHQIEQLLAQIPPAAAVSAQNNLVPHLSQRDQIYIYPKLSHVGHQAEYIVLDFNGSIAPFDTIEAYCHSVVNLLADSTYGLIGNEDGLFIFKLGQPNQVTPFVGCLPGDGE
jgi:uncharacterized membrane protein